MSFQPVIQVTKVPRTSTSFYFVDDTGNSPDNPTGWGATNAPAGPNQITSVWGEIQAYGSTPKKCTDVAGNIVTTCEVVVNVPDGVDVAHVYYGMQKTIAYTVSIDRLTLSFTDSTLPQILDNITSLSPDDISFPVRIKSVSGMDVLLEEAFPGSAFSYGILYKYWHAQQRLLVINDAEATIVNEISHLPLDVNNCTTSMSILNKIQMKLGAEIAFSCGNYAKADEAIGLINGYSRKVSQTCKNCG